MAVPPVSNVFLIALSGVSYAEVIGSGSTAPNINTLAAKYASSSGFSALTYPSLPNVLAMSGASTQGVTSNSPYQQFASSNIFVDRLQTQGLTWKIYAENLPTDPTTTSGGYAYFHNPQIFYSDAYTSGVDPHIVTYAHLSSDLTGLVVPSLAWILPNSFHNMSSGPTSIAAGDTWVNSAVAAIQASYPNALIVLWWDSDDGTGDNVVPLLFLSPQLVEVGYTSSTPYNHYNLLATIEAALGLNALGTNDSVASMDEFFAPGPAGGIFSAPTWTNFLTEAALTGIGTWDEETWDQSNWGDFAPAQVFQGSELFYQFNCQGNPFPKYSVASGSLPNGLVLDPDFGTLTGAPSSVGTYTFAIAATNGLGTSLTPPITVNVVSSQAAINPDDAPAFPNFTDPAGTVAEGAQYYFTVSVTTTGGTSAVSAPSAAAAVVQAPGPPTSPTAVGGNASAVVSWTAPTDTGGLPLSGYVITVLDQTLGTSSKVNASVTNTVNLTGLSNGHYYSFVIQAANTDNKILGRGVATQAVLCSGTSNVVSLQYPNPPANTPQPNYPTTVVSFTPVTDYPNSSPGDIGFAFNINALHSEVWALEQTVGPNPFAGLAYVSLSEALQDLAINKSNMGHTHSHTAMNKLDGDDHPQYAKVDGSRSFRQPVTAPPAVTPNELVTLTQVQGYGFNVSALSFGKNPVVGATAASVDTAVVPPLNFRADQSFPWMVVGGVFAGLTAPDGLIQIPFQPLWESLRRFSSMVITFEYTVTTVRANTTGAPAFDPTADSIDLYWVDLSHAMLYVSTTRFGLPQRFIGLTWKAVGL